MVFPSISSHLRWKLWFLRTTKFTTTVTTAYLIPHPCMSAQAVVDACKPLKTMWLSIHSQELIIVSSAARYGMWDPTLQPPRQYRTQVLSLPWDLRAVLASNSLWVKCKLLLMSTEVLNNLVSGYAEMQPSTRIFSLLSCFILRLGSLSCNYSLL